MDNKTKLKIKKVLKTACICLLVPLLFFGGYFTRYFLSEKDARSMQFVLDYYNKYYYKPSNEEPAKLVVDALMDIYSEYYTAEEYNKLTQEDNGNREGFGISFYQPSSNASLFKGINVYRVSGNSPAENSGLKKGDVITAYKLTQADEFINFTQSGKTPLEQYNDFIAFLQNVKAENSVVLSVLSDGEQKEYTVLKTAYNESYVYYEDNTGSYRFSDDGLKMNLQKYSNASTEYEQGWGYIKYVSFSGLKNDSYGSAVQFKTAIDMLFENGNDKVIIDLRNNGGGFMSILCKLAGILCPRADSYDICQVAIDKNGAKENFYIDYSLEKNSDGEKYAEKFKKIVFLANENSASASEALMGAVLDYDKQSGKNIVNVILDQSYLNGSAVYKSYGKGIMQTTYKNMLTGEAIKLTTATINWPISGTCIHDVGLTSDLDERIINSDGNSILQAQELFL